jgi:hypothetical protein
MGHSWNKRLFKAKPKGLISKTPPSKGITQHKTLVENYKFSHGTWQVLWRKKRLLIVNYYMLMVKT